MPIFYRGAGIGTYWHQHDAQLTGFSPQDPGMLPSVDRLIRHIAGGSIASPFVSLTRSYGVAWSYAVFLGRGKPDPMNPAYVYEVELTNPLPGGLSLLDPVKQVAKDASEPLDPLTYHHDGPPDFLLGIASPAQMGSVLTAPRPQPPPGGGTPRAPNLSIHLETLVRALRDAEILACGNIPATCVLRRIPVY